MLIDPGAPFEHGQESEAEEKPKPAAKSSETLRIEALEADLARERSARKEAEDDSKYWANRNRQPQQREEREDTPAKPAAPAAATEKPEKLLDDLTAEGLDALKKRGVITGPELATILEEHASKMEGRMQQVRQDAEFSARISAEFPEIAEDSQRLNRNEKPQTELFAAASRIYRQMVADDPALEGTNGALLIAARQAKAEILAKKKPAAKETDEVEEARPPRRARIERQASDRSPSGSEGDESHQDGFSKQQLEVMKHLKVEPQNFRKHAGVTRNGR